MEARARQVALVVVRRHLGAGRLEHARGSGRAPSPTQTRAGLELEVGGRERRAARRRRPRAAARRSRAARRALRRRARRASRRPAAGTSSASASPRAVARPMRVPVKLPGPVPTASAVELARRARRAWRRSASTSSSSVARARDALAEHLAVGDERARRDVSRRVEGEDQHRRSVLAATARPRRARIAGARGRRARAGRPRAAAGSAAGARLRPLDEDDRVVEVRLEVAPLRALETPVKR